MSFGDLLGKLQSVVSSFSVEETKKSEKKEDVLIIFYNPHHSVPIRNVT